MHPHRVESNANNYRQAAADKKVAQQAKWDAEKQLRNIKKRIEKLNQKDESLQQLRRDLNESEQARMRLESENKELLERVQGALEENSRKDARCVLFHYI